MLLLDYDVIVMCVVDDVVIAAYIAYLSFAYYPASFYHSFDLLLQASCYQILLSDTYLEWQFLLILRTCY